MSKNPKYWLVGANWSGDDRADKFYRRGYWELGYKDSEQPRMAQKRDSIQPGNRIAIKAMRGKGATTITIKCLGIVKEVAHKRVYVDWLIKDMNRKVAAKGCFQSIRGPYELTGRDAAWIREVFCL
jgi:hypothetical protein